MSDASAISELQNEVRELSARIERLEVPDGSTMAQHQLAKRIILEVCRFYDCTPRQLVSRTRTDELAWRRHVAMTLVRELTALTLCEVGGMFERDHGTVIHAIENVRNRCSVDQRACTDVQFLRGKFGGSAAGQSKPEDKNL